MEWAAMLGFIGKRRDSMNSLVEVLKISAGKRGPALIFFAEGAPVASKCVIIGDNSETGSFFFDGYELWFPCGFVWIGMFLEKFLIYFRRRRHEYYR
jgi:hypothetical protein